MPNDDGIPGRHTSPPRVAFVTWRGLPALSADDRLAAAACARRGFGVEPVVWDDPVARWSEYSAVVVRSTWDYHERPQEFLAWIERLEAEGIPLWNPPAVLRWNLDKRYLGELAQRGIAVVPTRIVPRGTGAGLAATLDECGWDDVVVKPAVSASAYRTWRASRSTARADTPRFAALLEAGDVLVQPFQPAIEQGEWSFCFFAGRYSHAVLKHARAGDFRVQSELGGVVLARRPAPSLVRQAEAVAAAAPAPWLYARADACEVEARLLLMELELIEPTLFFDADPGAPDRFAQALHT